MQESVILSSEFKIRGDLTENIIKLIDDGNTIPFIARYRKEMTGSCDDQVLREFADRLQYLRNLQKRREEVCASIGEQGKLTEELKAAIDAEFWGDFAGDAETSATIDKVWKNNGYLCDTHTAVGWYVAENYVNQTGDRSPMVVLSTASPYKFPAAVLSAIGGDTSGDEFDQMERLSQITGVPVPKNLTGLKELPELHTGVIPKDQMLSFVLNQ